MIGKLALVVLAIGFLTGRAWCLAPELGTAFETSGSVVRVRMAMNLDGVYARDHEIEKYGPDEIAAERSVTRDAVDYINEANRELEIPGLNMDAMLKGGNRIEIAVVDNATSKPIGEYTIHGVVLGHHRYRFFTNSMPDNDEISKEQLKQIINDGKFKMIDTMIEIGRLESLKVKDRDGRCAFEKLGKLDVQFQVLADGYAVGKAVVKIPDQKSLTVRLVRNGNIRGQLLGIDGAPLKQTTIKLNLIAKYRDGFDYHTNTSDDGSFELSNIKPDRYEFEIPSIPGHYAEIDDKIREVAYPERFVKNHEGSDPDFLSRRWEELGASPWPLPPPINPIRLKPGQQLDMGTIRLQQAPVLELRIVGQDGSPMADFPFELNYPAGDPKMKTDHEGKARVVLAGWKAGDEGIVLAPEASNKYREKRYHDYRDYVLTHSDQDLYEVSQRYDISGESKSYEELTAEQKAKLHEQYEKSRKERREENAKENAKPDHPNYAVFTARPGETCKVLLVYKPMEDALSPRFFFRDSMTGKPVPSCRGIIGFDHNDIYTLSSFDYEIKHIYHRAWENDARFFQSADQTGHITIAGLTMPARFLESEQHYHDQKNKGLAGPRQPFSRMTIDAPGYARQKFEVDTEQLCAGKELVFDLEPEARVTGRVLIGDKREPLTPQSLKAFLKKCGKWSDKLGESWSYSLPALVRIQFGEHWSDNDDQRFNGNGFSRIDKDGRFEVRGLKPQDNWSLIIETEPLPKYHRPNMTLKPGINDLGDIWIK